MEVAYLRRQRRVYSYANGNPIYDRDTSPGTGSTDFIIGGFKQGFLSDDQKLSYFVQATYEFAFMTIEGYRPGNELDAAAGLTYDFGAQGPFASGAPSDPPNSGYERVLLAPGLSLRVGAFKFFADVGFPVYQFANHAANVNIEGTDGQLVASPLHKAQVSYDF